MFAAMKISAFTVCDSYGAGREIHARRVLDFLHLAEVAEREGLDGIWVGEHHFRASGVCPSPAVLLAAASQRTSRTRLGVMVSVLPLHSPVSVAEEFAMVDVLSGGRLNLGVGSGYVPEELRAHGVDPGQRRERFESALAELLAAFRGEPVAASGGTRRDLAINVLPVQRPHPPVWVAVQRRESVEALARVGRSVALLPYASVGTRAELHDLIRTFHASARPGTRPEIAVAIHLYVGRRPERARAALDRYLRSRLDSGRVGPALASLPGHRLPSVPELEHEGFAAFGSAEHVVAELRDLEEASANEVLGMFDFGDLTPEEADRSIRSLTAAWRRSGGGTHARAAEFGPWTPAWAAGATPIPHVPTSP
jgi:alkanesulfonate monooxygenase SsuD/methylene tetrahydromethanopterin reductase-like flavin-dependent oxidoreductase (luciferase family)